MTQKHRRTGIILSDIKSLISSEISVDQIDKDETPLLYEYIQQVNQQIIPVGSSSKLSS